VQEKLDTQYIVFNRIFISNFNTAYGMQKYFCTRTTTTIITIDPDTLGRDTSLLKRVNEQMNLNFGVYTSVKKTGEIQVGQKIYLSN
jgi:predicted metal-dependent phosphotriesterase family hydrolase